MYFIDLIDDHGRCVIPDGVTEIGRGAFLGCKGLTSIEIPNSVLKIGERAFEECVGLTSIEIPGSVTKIGEWAFGECEELTSIEIPDSVTEIGKNAFNSWRGLTSVFIRTHEKSPEVSKNTLYILSYFDSSIVTLKVPAGCGEAYRHHPDFEGKFKEILEVLD